jgi:uncharacterized protein (DUF302 family)
MSYYFARDVGQSFDDAVAAITEQLKQRGFGVLTTIDVQATLKKKLDVDFRRYVILGACNPKFAYKALSSEPNIGAMLPCNVVVQETAEGKVNVSAVDPIASMIAVENPALVAIAGEVRRLLREAVEAT